MRPTILVAVPRIFNRIYAGVHEIEHHSTSFKSYEKPQKFLLTTEDFITENGMLTPTFPREVAFGDVRQRRTRRSVEAMSPHAHGSIRRPAPLTDVGSDP